MKVNKNKVLVLGFCLLSGYAIAQNGLSQGIDEATEQLNEVFDSVKTFLFVLAAIVALYGGFNVYSKYQAQDQDSAKSAAKFGFAFIFIMASAFVVEAVFIN